MASNSIKLLLVLSFSSASLSSNAWDESKKVDKDNVEALQKTQDLLKDRKAREEFAKDNPDALKALEQADKLGGGGATTEAMFAISADIMASIVAESGGDPEKMQALLIEAQKNPEAFFNRLSAKQKEQIRRVASEVEKKQATTKP